MSTGTYFDGLEEIEESDVQIATDARTKPLHPDPDPEGTRLMWEKVRAFRAQRRALAVKDEIEDDAAAEESAAYDVIEPSTLLENPEKAPGATGTLAQRLIAQDWSVEVMRKVEQVHAVAYVADSKAGSERQYFAGDERVPAYRLEWLWMRAARRNADGRIALALYATWAVREGKGQKFRGAETFDPILGREWRSTSLKPRKPREWEIEEGVEPPLGFNQWLALVAPKPEPAPKKTRKKTVPDDDPPTDVDASADTDTNASPMWQA